MSKAIRLPHGVTYTIDHQARTVYSTFPDGSLAVGVASFGDEDIARARSLGYEGDHTKPPGRCTANTIWRTTS